MKVKVNVSLSPDTAERLRQYAYEHHETVSQTVTDWTWDAKVEGAQIRGQQTIQQLK